MGLLMLPPSSRRGSGGLSPGSVTPRTLAVTMGLVLLLLAAGFDSAEAVLPTGELRLADGSTAYAAPAWFGLQLPEEKEATHLPLRVPKSDADGCGKVTVEDPPEGGGGFVLLVERGNCFFDAKALAAQEAGAEGLVVMNSVEGIYQDNSAATDKYDYECDNGEGWVKDLQTPVWDPLNTDEACWSNDACDSGVCVVTNVTEATLGTKVCCAWDMYITMYSSDPETSDKVGIPSVYVTMKDGQALLEAGEVDVEIFNRPRSYINLSSFLLWGLGVATVVWASVKSGDDLRRRSNSKSGDGSSGVVNYGGDSHEESPSLELGVRHTLAFVVFASGMLLLLFFFNLGLGVTLMFCLSASTATSAIVVLPLMRWARATLVDYGFLWSDGDGGTVDCYCLGVLSGLEIASTITSMGLALWWLIVRNTTSYAWVLQNLFGCCLCATFLSTIRLPSIKVATFLLCLAFLYDIFWVFLSPQLFGESVMVKVATGGEITQDPTFCEKYPTSDGCQVESLPMLLELPRLWDYTGGYAMLGLGDIVIPGLLLSFAHRYDLSVGLHWGKGYFVFMVAGYAVGLLMANMAVYVMSMGQPALLYLVPCTLGLFLFLSYNDGTLRMMWGGPPSLSTEHAGYDGLSSSDGNLDRGAKPGQGMGDERQHQRWMGGGGGGGLPDSGSSRDPRGWGVEQHSAEPLASSGWRGSGGVV
ncbi:putative growth-on protein GRO10 [Ectocarpus siliculosus]|uniref:Growth-on protein GRO10 n=1 Tax=Ectocarpus siliculosus TaxID=2880 RepID=D7G2W6_ECTSI|nr:putative growth-on protein GRO10 [Ectocarpus siliculosus]|eukprot:CBJ48823.1 putative growth-on protein GRO10 [Ectocarpus siliculosus]